MGSLVAVDGGRSRCRAAGIGADDRPGPVAEGPGSPPAPGPRRGGGGGGGGGRPPGRGGGGRGPGAGGGPRGGGGWGGVRPPPGPGGVGAPPPPRHEVGQVETVSAGLAGLLGSRDLAPAVATSL